VSGFPIHNSFYYHFCLPKLQKTAQKTSAKPRKRLPRVWVLTQV